MTFMGFSNGSCKGGGFLALRQIYETLYRLIGWLSGFVGQFLGGFDCILKDGSS
jgi:hypothetical protein